MAEKMRVVAGRKSWRLAASAVEAFVTRTGGHVAPVTFNVGGKKIQPFHIAPWWNEKVDPKLPNILKVLRGDFFCMPFGSFTEPYKGEQYQLHGETANRDWTLEMLETEGGMTALHCSMKAKARPARVDKLMTVIDRDPAVYCRHVISGAKGPMTMGHHPTLKLRSPGVMSFSRFVFGQVYVKPVENPEQGGYSTLRPGAVFDRLEKVPLLDGGMTDVSRYPARRGFEDIVLLANDRTLPFAWSAVTFPKERAVWFALKDPRVLPSTMLWMSNGGRHYAPWSGRNVDVLGVEEINGYFFEGLAPSARKNGLNKRGVPTTVMLSPKAPTVVNYVMAMAAVPAGFDKVARMEPMAGGQFLELIAASGKRAKVSVDASFLL